MGGVLPCLDCLFYAKGGVTYLRNDFYMDHKSGVDTIGMTHSKLGISKVVPFVSLGVEKIIYRPSSGTLNLRLEWEHRFNSTKKRTDKDENMKGFFQRYRGKLRGDVVRVILLYRFGN